MLLFLAGCADFEFVKVTSASAVDGSSTQYIGPSFSDADHTGIVPSARELCRGFHVVAVRGQWQRDGRAAGGPSEPDTVPYDV
jgi:hypothetical protein